MQIVMGSSMALRLKARKRNKARDIAAGELQTQDSAAIVVPPRGSLLLISLLKKLNRRACQV
jgi:hypothetical protein